MHCPECEAIEDILFDATTIWFHPPTAHAVEKIEAMCAAQKIALAKGEGGVLSVTLTRDQVGRFATALFGQFGQVELQKTALVTTDGRPPVLADLGRTVTGEVFVNRVNAIWLMEALDQHRYESWFHPIVDARTLDLDRPFGREALFRMRDAAGTQVPPGLVFDLAGRADLLFALDLAARRSAVECNARFRGPAKLFINFNPTSIYDPSYCLRATAAAISEVGMRPADVVFELTESNRADLDHLKGILAFYRQMGFPIALDDIGSGWSGLNLLHQLRPDYVKIDMDLVRGIDQDGFKQSIVHHLVQIARSEGIKVIGEGVETAGERDWLVAEGVDYLQGYLFARPAPAPALAA